MDELDIFIGGQWRRGGGNLMHSQFPADGAINAALHAASLDDLQEAIDCADRAWREPTWRAMLPHQRAKILHKVADLIEAQLDELTQKQSRDNGKPLAEARGLVMSAAGTARYFAAACELLEGELPTPRQADLIDSGAAMSRWAWWRRSPHGTRRSPAKCRRWPRRSPPEMR